MAPISKFRDILLLAALFCSGVAALAFELMWTRLLSLVIGSEVLGILGVLAGFFGGMVLGAAWMSKNAVLSKNPIRTFIVLESCIAIYGLISPFIIFKASKLIPIWLGHIAGDNNTISALFITLLVSGLLLLPATFCMGANFAYLVEARRRIFSRQGKSKNIGRVYAANTTGALIGTMLGIYLVLPLMGFYWSALLFSLISALSIYFALRWKNALGKKVSALASPIPKVPTTKPNREEMKWMGLLFFTGLLAIGFEIVVIHLLKQVLEDTVFTFANILSVYLLGTVVGAWLFQALPLSKRKASGIPSLILLALVLWSAVDIVFGKNLLSILDALSVPGSQLFPHLVAEWAITGLFFLIPSALMGALFAYITGKVRPALVGHAFAVNTLGATIAPFAFGLFLIPSAGSYYSMVSIMVLYAILLISFTGFLRWKIKYALGGLAISIFFLFLPNKSFELIELKKDWVILEKKEGLSGTVVVSELPGQTGPLGLSMRILQVNNRFKMGGGAGFLEKRMGHLPMLLKEKTDDVLFLGLGSGITVGAATRYDCKKITGVEIVPEVSKLLNWFSDHNNDILNKPNVELHTADARRFVLASPDTYDLIVADLYHPARDGAGMLYTREHYKNLKSKLKKGGMVVQWIPLHQFDFLNLKMVLRTFQSVFPESHMFLGGYNPNTPVIALVAGTEPFNINTLDIERSVLSSSKIQLVFENLDDVVSSYVTGPDAIKTFAGDGPINTDTHPRILFKAPASAYIPETELTKTNLECVLKLRSRFPEAILTNIDNNKLDRLKSHWEAAGAFIDHHVKVIQKKDFEAYQALLKAYQTNPDFSPARGKILGLISSGALPYNQVEHVLTDREKQRLNK